MHLLPCPHCEAPIAVSPSQAGDDTTCPSCQSAVVIPKLGQLRQLPTAGDASEGDVAEKLESSFFSQGVFITLGLIATACLLIAGFCGIRWALIDVPVTTESHIEALREEYDKLSAARLIREYEDMEKYSLDLAAPFQYKQLEVEKHKWGRNASIAAGVGALCMVGAFGVANATRRKRD